MSEVNKAKAYEVWDTPSGNLLAYFERYGQALDFLQEQVEGLGIEWIKGIALLEVKPDQHVEVLGQDHDLLPLIRVEAKGAARSDA